MKESLHNEGKSSQWRKAEKSLHSEGKLTQWRKTPTVEESLQHTLLSNWAPTLETSFLFYGKTRYPITTHFLSIEFFLRMHYCISRRHHYFTYLSSYSRSHTPFILKSLTLITRKFFLPSRFFFTVYTFFHRIYFFSPCILSSFKIYFTNRNEQNFC